MMASETVGLASRTKAGEAVTARAQREIKARRESILTRYWVLTVEPLAFYGCILRNASPVHLDPNIAMSLEGL